MGLLLFRDRSCRRLGLVHKGPVGVSVLVRDTTVRDLKVRVVSSAFVGHTHFVVLHIVDIRLKLAGFVRGFLFLLGLGAQGTGRSPAFARILPQR